MTRFGLPPLLSNFMEVACPLFYSSLLENDVKSLSLASLQKPERSVLVHVPLATEPTIPAKPDTETSPVQSTLTLGVAAGSFTSCQRSR